MTDEPLDETRTGPERVRNHEAAFQAWAERLIEWDDQSLTFLARDLGFDDHTRIHRAVKPILADHIARMIVSHFQVMPGPLPPHLQKRSRP